jgi:hypothetical protein
MYKSMVVLALAGMMSSPVLAQAAPAPGQATAAKPQTVKKRVCYKDDEDSYSRLGGRKICKTVEVPIQPASGGNSNDQQQTAPQPESR